MFERSKKDGADKTGGSTQDYSSPAASTPASSPSYTTGSGGETAVIGRSIQIDGDLRGEEDLRIEGDVNGTVQLRNNTLTIGSEGKIHANVYAKSVTIDGLMDGDVFGSERVSIRKNAQVRGNITAPRVSLEDGARFKGSIEMDSAAVEAAFAQMGDSSGRRQTASGAGKGPKAVAKPEAATRKTESVG